MLRRRSSRRSLQRLNAYTQAGYLELTGWAAPACGGPTFRQLNPEQNQTDTDARLQIRELGQITRHYLPRAEAIKFQPSYADCVVISALACTPAPPSRPRPSPRGADDR